MEELWVMKTGDFYEVCLRPSWYNDQGMLLNNEELALQQCYPLVDVKPEFDSRRFFLEKNPSNQWILVSNVVYVTYNKTPLEEDKAIEEHYLKCKHVIDTNKMVTLEQGLSFEYDGNVYHIQTRLIDKINLLGINAEAHLQNIGLMPTKLIDLRTRENINLLLSAEEAFNLTTNALSFITRLYKQSWAMKDSLKEIKESFENDEINFIPALDQMDSVVATGFNNQ